MPDDDSSTDDAPGSNDGDASRRAVLGGVVAAAGAALGFSGAAAARESTRPDAGGVQASVSTRDCPPGCYGEFWCCEYDGGVCSEWCTLCDCE